MKDMVKQDIIFLYSHKQVPFNDEGRVDVSVDLDILQILEVDDIKFTVSFSMYFGVRWEEPRYGYIHRNLIDAL